jgi:phosphohistidine phosphatase
MNLYIIRHAIAVDEATPDYESDSERPLTDKGRKKMRQIAKALRYLGVEFDLILSSPYVRACETAEILADVFKMKNKIAFSEPHSAGDPDLLIAEVREDYSVNNIALVGLEPHLSTLAGLLVAENTAISRLEKAGYVSLRGRSASGTSCHTKWLLTRVYLWGC